jgi:putative nucleotidyltransferase-like protein
VSQELLDEGVALVEAAAADDLMLRLLGGAAIMLHSGVNSYRQLGDLDAVVRQEDARAIGATLRGRGYEPESRFNALHGDRRQIFHGPKGKLDVFVEVFEMCHRIALGRRLLLDSPTLTVSDLLLTKLQVVELNAKDAEDAAVLLRAHEFGHGEGDRVNLDYVTALAADDWGLWRTLTGTLERLEQLQPDVAPKVRGLRHELDEAPKTRRFRLRARVGERKRWYELPDEVG